MRCTTDCKEFRAWVDGFGDAGQQSDYDMHDSVTILERMFSEVEPNTPCSNREVFEEVKRFRLGYIDLLLESSQDQGLNGLWVLSAIAQATKPGPCTTCPFKDLGPEQTEQEKQAI